MRSSSTIRLASPVGPLQEPSALRLFRRGFDREATPAHCPRIECRPMPRKPKEAFAQTKRRAAAVFRRLRRAYPDAKTALDHTNPLELLVATILSAQSTDKGVNL